MNITKFVVASMMAMMIATLSRGARASYQDNCNWELMGTASHRHSDDRDKYRFDVVAGHDYAVKIEHESSKPYEIIVTNKKGREYARREGWGTVTASFDTRDNYSGRMYLEVASHGAKGKYRIYLCDQEGYSYTGGAPNFSEWRFIDESYHSGRGDVGTFQFNVDPGSYYQVKIDHDSSDSYEISVVDARGREYVSGRGTRVTIAAFDTVNQYEGRMTVKVKSLGARGRYRVYLRQALDSGTSSMSYPGNYNYRDADYTLDFADLPQGRVSGDATVHCDGNTVRINGHLSEQGVGDRAWDATGTVSDNVMQFDWRTERNERGTARLTRLDSGDWDGTFTIFNPNNSPTRRLILRFVRYR